MSTTTTTQTTGPAVDTPVVADTAASAQMETYNLYYTTSRTNVTFHRGDNKSPAEYYGFTQSFNLKKPQVFLKKGDTKKSPTIGVIRIQYLSKNMMIGRGDYEKDENSVFWEELHRKRNAFMWSDYSFTVHDDAGGKVDLTWRKDKSLKKAFATVYTCVDDSGKIYGQLNSGGAFNLQKAGEFEVLASSSEVIKEWLLTSALGIWAWEALNMASLTQGFDKNNAKKA